MVDTSNQIPMQPKEGGSGPIVSIILIILILAAGGLYFFQVERASMPSETSDAALQQTLAGDPQTEALKTTASSDTAASIEEDLANTDFGDIDAELADIESEL